MQSIDSPAPFTSDLYLIGFSVVEHWKLGWVMTSTHDSGPERIVCLTEETTETLYLLGEEHRIVGISGFTLGFSRRARSGL
jgi:ABC-type hemin transport system substrate-binding protein